MKDKTQPDHYKTESNFDVIDFNKAYNLNFNLGNVVKYIARAGKKKGEAKTEDLDKALEYLNREINSDLPKKTPEENKVLKQCVIGFCINCDNHTELTYFNDIDLFMCNECRDLRFRNERENDLEQHEEKKVNLFPTDGSDPLPVFMAFAPVPFCVADEACDECHCNKDQQKEHVSTCVECDQKGKS